MNKSWFNYYKNHNSVALSNILLHWPYLLNMFLINHKKILEIGCGPADHSVFLSSVSPRTQISLLDYDKNIINSLRSRLSNKISKFYVCDITSKKNVDRLKFKKNEFDLIYSQGLMEHFDKKDFQTIIKNFLPYSKKILISIPAENYPNRDFGNELLRNKEQLIKIIKPIKNIEFKINKYFPDIGIRTKIIKIKKEKIGFFNAIYLILFGSLHYLIKVDRSN